MSLSEIYKALSDDSRLRLIHLLSKGCFNVQELTSIIRVSQPTISHHLKVLQSAGIVKSHKEGTWVYYTLLAREESALPSLLVNGFLTAVQSPALNGLGDIFRADLSGLTSIIDSRRTRSQSFFNEIAPQWKQVRSNVASVGVTDESSLDEIASLIQPYAALLDVGCGTGALLERVLPREGTTIGVDYSPAMLTEAARTLSEKSLHADLRLGSLEHLPVADTTIDVAVTCMVLHHISNPQEALRDLHRVLKPKGLLVVVDLTPHHEERMREQFSHLWLGFDPQEFQKWLIHAGFKSGELTHFGPNKEIFLLTAKKQ